MTSPRSISVGSALSDKMIVSELSAEQLAALTGIDAARVRDLERGTVSMNIDELFAFSEFFNCPVSDFFIGLYDFYKHHEDFQIGVSDEFFERYMLTYFKKIRDPVMKKLMCSIVRQTAEMEKEKMI